MTTILEKFSMPAVSGLQISDRNYKVHPDYTFANPDLLVGLELEIEGWNDDHERSFRGFRFETDGSLRNNGIEAITLPLASKHVPNLLESFYKKFGITEDNYSTRCSTHVHINAQDLSIEQVRTVCTVYQALERVLYAFIGNDRDSSIFCVPWYQCNISQEFVCKFTGDINFTTRTWQKYTGLNIIPLRDRGTLEFRHLEGTCDVKRIVNWVNIIGSIVRFSKEVNYKDLKEMITDMNTVSNYAGFVEQVFREYSYLLTSLPDYSELLSLGVVDCKLCMMEKEDTSNLARRFTPRAEDLYAPVATPPTAARITQRMLDDILSGR
jgi:Putative amidoligase enzyme